MNAHRSTRGFTLIEILIIMAMMMALAVFSLPELFAAINRSRLEGTARQTATLMRAARLDSIKESCYGVVMIDTTNRRVLAFLDRDSDGVYEPTNTPPEKLIGMVDLPPRINFLDEAGNVDLASVDGFNNSAVLAALADKQAMYQQDGSALSKGAFRFADDKGNVLEVRLEPKTTGKVEVRKHLSGIVYTANGEGGKAWKFNK